MMDGASNAAPRISGLPALFDLSGRVALITGSSGGLGLTMAHALCEAGASVILNGRDEARLAGARAELEEHGFTVGTSAFDVTKSAEIGRAVADILTERGRIDILVNNAGIQHRTPLHEFPEDAFRRVIETNLTSAFLVGQAVVQG